MFNKTSTSRQEGCLSTRASLPITILRENSAGLPSTTFEKIKSGAGFSIIETLVAITILTIVITGSITAINKGLAVSTETRNQVTASLLAQDAMEYIKNRKFTNIQTLGESNWLNDIGGCIKSVSGPGPCKVDSMVANGSGISECPSSSVCPVYIGAIGYHQTTIGSPDVQTIFNRSFYLEDTANGRQRKVVVNVTWKTAGVPYSVKLVDYIFSVAW